MIRVPVFCAAVVTSLAVTAGCSSSSSTPAATQADGGADDAALPSGQSTITFTMQSKVPASSETHQCMYVTGPAALAFIVASKHVYTPGSHHMLLFRTDLTSIPAGMDKPGDCYEAATGGYMSHVRGVVYGAQVPTAQFTYPDGVGLQLDASSVFMMQTHYLNSGSAELDARADVTLTLSDGTGITQHAGVLFFYDPFIYVPMATKARASMRCGIRNDITLLTATSHYHKRGNDYAAYVDPGTGAQATTPFYTSNNWDSPPALPAPMKIAAGSHIRFGCGYDNTAGTKEYFQGQSAEDNEMCMFTGLYYPALGTPEDMCLTTHDTFGTGTNSCSSLLSCLKTCPPLVIGTAQADIDPCNQKCFVGSCPEATGLLIALQNCTKSKCATECADRASTTCSTCAQANCLDEATACFTDKCN